MIIMAASSERIKSQHFAMGKLTCSFFITAVLLSTQAQPHAQNLLSMAPKGISEQILIVPKVAETLLVHKEEPACKNNSAGVRVTGTVVIAITIDKNGKVSHPRTISGPKMLRALALATVRKYRYNPYLLNKKPIEVETVVSIPIDCFFYSGQA